jgi:hypothetical protein
MRLYKGAIYIPACSNFQVKITYQAYEINL